jgi:2-methylcitrate dehydratase PrpD
VNTAGIVGSCAAGILQCWVDGTQSKFLHSGWAAQSGITAAFLGRAGNTGPGAVFEGRFGLFESHLQDQSVPRAFERITGSLGRHWDSQHASFKPYPAAHVLHPYIDALLKLRKQHSIDPREVREILCPVAGYIIPIVCEPVAEKRRPNTDSHGRVSLQYTLAEALHFGELGKDAYQPASLRNADILRLADLVSYRVDASFPGPERFKGVVRVVLNSGATYEAIEENTRGSAENPMTRDELLGKFETNAATVLTAEQSRRLMPPCPTWKPHRMRARWCSWQSLEADSMRGKCALITGSTAGLGAATAARLAAEGCNIALNGFGDLDAIETQRRELEKTHGVRALSVRICPSQPTSRS